MTFKFRVILFLVLLSILSLQAGCASYRQTQEVKTAIPIVCQATEPQRPVMPTDSLTPDSTLDQFIQAVTAEIERRAGYEDNLVAALRSCTNPLKDTP